MTEIVLDRISKTFAGGLQALHETSLTIHDGEFFILVGPSGCGKSTLLNLIVGLEQVSSGEIRIDGRRVNELDPKDRNMSMVFQSYAIYPHMTIRENIAFPLKMAKLPKPVIAQRVEQIAELLELSDLLERKPATLSGGQRQRVAMGRALVRNPAAFLLDEPLSNLDARLRVQMRAEIGRLQKQLATTLIYVTHDQAEAMTLGDRVAVLNQGHVQQIATPQQLYQHPKNLFVAGFIGSPRMNFVPARIEDTELILPFAKINLTRLPLGSANRPLIAAFRPESVRLMAAIDTRDTLNFSIDVNTVEWLGAEVFVYTDIAIPASSVTYANDLLTTGCTLVFRLAPHIQVNPGEKLSLSLNVADIHLFDAISGNNLFC